MADLQPSTPSIVVNLSRVRDAFDDQQFSALESVFRALFRNVESSRQLTAQVVNSNQVTAGTGIDITDGVISVDAGALEGFPVGAIYTSISDTDPATTLGYGTWAVFGAGKCLMGYESGVAPFDVVENTGGSRDAVVVDHTHGITDPGHNHSYQNRGTATDTAGGGNTRPRLLENQTTGNNTTGITIDNAGVSGTDANLPPYVVVYFWERTA